MFVDIWDFYHIMHIINLINAVMLFNFIFLILKKTSAKLNCIQGFPS